MAKFEQGVSSMKLAAYGTTREKLERLTFVTNVKAGDVPKDGIDLAVDNGFVADVPDEVTKLLSQDEK